MSQTTGVVVQTGNDARIDQMIAVWLDSKHNKSGSDRTVRAYDDTLRAFRAALRSVGLDLESATTDEPKVVLVLQMWAETDATGRKVAPATFNHRLAVVSSFYTFARKRRYLHCENPVDLMERAKVEAYANARSLPPTTVEAAMNRIDRSTMLGKRDYALLSVAFTTGRRRAELAALQRRDIDANGEHITLTWRRAKGAKVMRDALQPVVSRALNDYLQALGDVQAVPVTADAPLWIALDNAHWGHPLTVSAISKLYLRNLGVSKVHTSRYTFSDGMRRAKAHASEIQARLGHSSLQTTGRYLAALESAENPHADALVQLFGLK